MGGVQTSTARSTVAKLLIRVKKKIVFVLQESTCEDSDDRTLHARVLITVFAKLCCVLRNDE